MPPCYCVTKCEKNFLLNPVKNRAFHAPYQLFPVVVPCDRSSQKKEEAAFRLPPRLLCAARGVIDKRSFVGTYKMAHACGLSLPFHCHDTIITHVIVSFSLLFYLFAFFHASAYLFFLWPATSHMCTHRMLAYGHSLSF